MTSRRAAVWIFRLEESANVTEYLVHVWPNGKVELEESPALAELLPPGKGGYEIDLRAALAEDVLDDDRNVAPLLCDYTREIKFPRRLLRQILRARSRGYHRDAAKMPLGDPWRAAFIDPLATTIDAGLEKIFWREWVEFLVVRPARRADLTLPQRKRPPKNSEINFPSGAGSLKRF
jgi:hypothetical protein